MPLLYQMLHLPSRRSFCRALTISILQTQTQTQTEGAKRSHIRRKSTERTTPRPHSPTRSQDRRDVSFGVVVGFSFSIYFLFILTVRMVRLMAECLQAKKEGSSYTPITRPDGEIVYSKHHHIQKLQPEIVQHILLGMPSLAFFTTYALLSLFWTEIYYQARAVSTNGLIPIFYTINVVVVYVVQVLIHM